MNSGHTMGVLEKELMFVSAKAFLRGVGVGLVTGVVADMMVNPRPKARKTTVGKTMEKLGNAMDSALDSVTSMKH